VPFSQSHADVALNFFEKILKHTADEWWGKPFMLAPWQEQALTEIFGRLDDDGKRLIQMVYLEIPKKSGKTEFAAGLLLLLLVLASEPGFQAYGAAAATRQSLNVYRACCKMVEQSLLLQKNLRLLRGTNRILKKNDPDSFYAAVAADGDLSDGVNPGATVCDEVHRWRNRKHLENFDVLSLGGITRRQTLTICITTAGVQSESPIAWRLHEKTQRIKEGIISDPTFYGRIYSAEKDDDWTSEKTWIRANPSLKDNGGFLDLQKIREKYTASLGDPEAQRSFRRYFLNIWGEKENRCIDMDQWDKCAGDWEARGLGPMAPEDKVRPLHPEIAARFIDKRAWVGIDLSMTTDFTAVTFVFPDDDGNYDLLPFYWMPNEGIKKRELRDGMPYRTWADQGFLELCDGNVIDFRDVRARLEWGSRMFDLQLMCFDKYESRQLSVPMGEEGYLVTEIPQGFPLSGANKKFLELVASGKLRHGNHPILRFNASCLSSKEVNDRLMFVKPERQKTSARIDGIQAAVDALDRAMVDSGPAEYPLAIL
jgi:phage terminase large subunit-like protein